MSTASTLPPTEPAIDAPIRFLRLEAVIERVGLQRSAIYELMAEGDFPQGVPLTKRATGWPEHEVTAWQRARMARRQGAD